MRALYRNERGRHRGKCVNFAARARSSGINHSMFPVFADIHLPTRPPVTPGLDFPSFSLHSAREKVTPRSCARRWPQKIRSLQRSALFLRLAPDLVHNSRSGSPPLHRLPRRWCSPRVAPFTSLAAPQRHCAARRGPLQLIGRARCAHSLRRATLLFRRPPLLAALLLSVGFPPIPVTTIFRGVAMLTSGDAGVRVRASHGVVCVGSGEGVRGSVRAEAGCPPFFLSWLEVHDDWKVPLR